MKLPGRSRNLRSRFAANLRRERTRQGLTQEVLAEQAGLNPRQIRKAEAGANATLDTIDQLAKALGIDPQRLLDP